MPFDPEIRAALIDQVRRFVRERCVPAEAQVAEDDLVPLSLLGKVKCIAQCDEKENEQPEKARQQLKTDSLVETQLPGRSELGAGLHV